MIKKYFSKKAQMSYFQILILIISTFAFCYLVYSATGSVSAQTLPGYSCCEETNDGSSCQFVADEECKQEAQSAPTMCEETSFCKLGCCYSSGTGLCDEKTPKRSCNGQWFDNEVCNIAQCSRGCCVLGNDAFFTSERNCEVESGFLGLETDFRSEINTEIECIFLAERDDEGACILDDECRFITSEECRGRGGNFYKDVFCSDESLETNCVAKDHKECVEGKDSVYWFDSCGNKEDIAEECSLFIGNYCGLVAGEPACKSVNCEDIGKRNGESWCEYDGTIGDGRDVVGSRHVKHLCFMGEERIEPCQDYRNQICVESKTDLNEGGSFSEAACRVNNWRSCLDYNTRENTEKMREECDENPDCIIKGVNIDKFNFDMCVPKYPAGFDLSSEESGKNAEMACSMASQTCTVIYVKRFSHRKFVGWDCVANCDCEKSIFTQQMNELCTSLGDCGGYVNIAGEYTDDGYSSDAGKIGGEQYRKYARNNPGQDPAEPGNLSFLGGGAWLSPENPEYEGGGISKLKIAGMAVAGLGALGIDLMSGVYKTLAGLPVIGDIGTGVGEIIGNLGPSIGTSTSASSAITAAGAPHGAGAATGTKTATTAFGNAVATAAAIWSVQNFLSTGFGVKSSTAWIVSGGVVVAALAIWGTPALKPLGIIGIIIAITMLALGIGKSKKVIVNFKCMPWQAPTGGDNCYKCNANDPFETPCTEYRCQSLGQTCEFINKGTDQELCIDNSPTDVSSPRISPLFGTMTKGYEYYDISANGFRLVESDNLGCIPEFTPIEFGIETDKVAQCKISEDPLHTYDQMTDYFGGSNLYLTNHTNLMFMPSPEAFRNQYNLTDEQIKALGEINFYVKCKSINGAINAASYTIRTCVEPGPDLTAPRIARTEPENNGYIGYNQTKQELDIWINEPSNCKYSNEDRGYDLMENQMSCKTDLEDYGLYGWACETNLTNLDENSDIYIKCQDISDNKNTMTESYAYSLQKSASELMIDEVRPINNAEIFSGVEPMTVELQVKTSGGAEQGKAKCYYDFGVGEIGFYETDSNYHNQVFNRMTRGRYEVDIRCEDVAGNTAETSTLFRVRIDSTGPRIIRMYYDSGMKVITDEQAECRYSFDEFNWDEAEIMSGDGIEHIGNWQLRTYIIQCKDEYGKKGGKRKVKGYSLIS